MDFTKIIPKTKITTPTKTPRFTFTFYKKKVIPQTTFNLGIPLKTITPITPSPRGKAAETIFQPRQLSISVGVGVGAKLPPVTKVPLWADLVEMFIGYNPVTKYSGAYNKEISEKDVPKSLKIASDVAGYTLLAYTAFIGTTVVGQELSKSRLEWIGKVGEAMTVPYQKLNSLLWRVPFFRTKIEVPEIMARARDELSKMTDLTEINPRDARALEKKTFGLITNVFPQAKTAGGIDLNILQDEMTMANPDKQHALNSLLGIYQVLKTSITDRYILNTLLRQWALAKIITPDEVVQWGLALNQNYPEATTAIVNAVNSFAKVDPNLLAVIGGKPVTPQTLISSINPGLASKLPVAPEKTLINNVKIVDEIDKKFPNAKVSTKPSEVVKPIWTDIFKAKTYPALDNLAVWSGEKLLFASDLEEKINIQQESLQGAGFGTHDAIIRGLNDLKNGKIDVSYYNVPRIKLESNGSIGIRLDIDNYLIDSGKLTEEDRYNYIFDAVEALSKIVPKDTMLNIPELKYSGTINTFAKPESTPKLKPEVPVKKEVKVPEYPILGTPFLKTAQKIIDILKQANIPYEEIISPSEEIVGGKYYNIGVKNSVDSAKAVKIIKESGIIGGKKLKHLKRFFIKP